MAKRATRRDGRLKTARLDRLRALGAYLPQTDIERGPDGRFRVVQRLTEHTKAAGVQALLEEITGGRQAKELEARARDREILVAEFERDVLRADAEEAVKAVYDRGETNGLFGLLAQYGLWLVNESPTARSLLVEWWYAAHAGNKPDRTLYRRACRELAKLPPGPARQAWDYDAIKQAFDSEYAFCRAFTKFARRLQPVLRHPQHEDDARSRLRRRFSLTNAALDAALKDAFVLAPREWARRRVSKQLRISIERVRRVILVFSRVKTAR